MNCNQANEIPMTEIISRLCNVPPGVAKGRSVWFISPFRDEKKTSFRVDLQTNKWMDFGKTGKNEGTVIDFVMEFNSCSVGEALNIVSSLASYTRQQVNNSFFSFHEQISSSDEQVESEKGVFQLKKVQTLQNQALINYLCERRIFNQFSKELLKEIYYKNNKNGKEYFAVASVNDSGGYEFRNKYMHGVIGKKDITSLNFDVVSDSVSVFEGITDYLSYKVVFEDSHGFGPVIVLNSVNLAEKAFDKINEQSFATVNLFLDNDKAGDECTYYMIGKLGASVVDNRHLFREFKDLNDFHVSGLSSE